MKAVAYKKSMPISNPESLVDIDLPMPVSGGHDLLVKINAIAVNPVDYKVRQSTSPNEGGYKVLGWDAVGEVVKTGELVSQYKVGDQVFYAGDITRQGSNAEYQLVDERLVGSQPKSLSNAQAAALPLTAITAWEVLFEHLGITQQAPTSAKKSDEIILLVGAAGGVGSIFLQLVKAVTGAVVIATASRKNSQAWVKQLGADYVIDHSQPLESQIKSLGIGQVTHVASLNSTDSYFESYVNLLAPFGKIAMIDDARSLDVTKLKLKSLSLHWESMFARSRFNTVDMNEQNRLLNRVAELVDLGHIKTTLGENLGAINANNLKLAHEKLESGRSIGKIVLEGF